MKMYFCVRLSILYVFICSSIFWKYPYVVFESLSLSLYKEHNNRADI